MSRREEILARIRDVPSLPGASLEVIRVLQEPDVDIAALTKAIQFDPGLTSNLLKLANSAYFGCPRSVGSVKEAVVRIGLKNLTRLLLPLTVAQTARRPVRGYDLAAGALLDHSVAVAVSAQEIAAVKGMEFPREAFTAALLHDLGKIVLGTFVEVDAAAIHRAAFDEAVSFEKVERRLLGIDHAEAGAVLLQNWNCPERIVEVARWHHQPEGCPGNPMVPLVHLADALSISQGIGAGADGLNYEVSSAVIESFELTAEALEAISCRVMGGLEEMRAVLGLKPGVAPR